MQTTTLTGYRLTDLLSTDEHDALEIQNVSFGDALYTVITIGELLNEMEDEELANAYIRLSEEYSQLDLVFIVG